MNIQVQRLNKVEGDNKVKAFVDLIIEGELVLKGFKVVEGKEGLFVGKPSQKGKDSVFYNTVLFLTEDVKEQINKVVLESYNKKGKI